MVKRLAQKVFGPAILVMYPDRQFYKTEIERISYENDQMREVNQKLKQSHNTLQVEFQTQFCSRKLSVQTRFFNDMVHIIWTISYGLYDINLVWVHFFYFNWHSTWKGQQALEKIASFASVISESYNQDDAGDIQDIMKLASQMGNSLKTNVDGDDV